MQEAFQNNLNLLEILIERKLGKQAQAQDCGTGNNYENDNRSTQVTQGTRTKNPIVNKPVLKKLPNPNNPQSSRNVARLEEQQRNTMESIIYINSDQPRKKQDQLPSNNTEPWMEADEKQTRKKQGEDYNEESYQATKRRRSGPPPKLGNNPEELNFGFILIGCAHKKENLDFHEACE
nr:unnamed protein product [Callosobruchus analis]